MAMMAKKTASQLLFVICVICVICGPASAQKVVDKMVATVNAGVKTDLITYSDLLWQLALQPDTPIDNPRRKISKSPSPADRSATDTSGSGKTAGDRSDRQRSH